MWLRIGAYGGILWTCCKTSGCRQWNFLGQIAASRCESFPTFREMNSSPSSGCFRWFGSTTTVMCPTLCCVYLLKMDSIPWNKLVVPACASAKKNDPQSVDAESCMSSFSGLSYDRSKASSKASSPYSAIYSFLLEIRISSPFLKVIQ